MTMRFRMSFARLVAPVSYTMMLANPGAIAAANSMSRDTSLLLLFVPTGTPLKPSRSTFCRGMAGSPARAS